METNQYIGKEFGSYRLIEKLDSGGFGSVYLARHMVLANRVVAVKLLHTMYLDSEEVRASFLEEARFLEMLKHPSILPIIDINIAEDGFPYLVTEYAPGGSLRARMRTRKGQPFSLKEALQILAQAGAGLSYAHTRNIIHRDLKPENILFNEKGEALLADFGLATTLATASEKYVSSSGTPAYMAPEQFKGLVSKESDQYALGCIAYELLTGQKPFQGNNAVEMMYQHLQVQPVPPINLNAGLSQKVAEVLLKAISKTRQERFSSIDSFLHALEEAAGTEESFLLTDPALSYLETRQMAGEETLSKEEQPRLIAVEQDTDAIGNLRSSASTVEITLKKDEATTLLLPDRAEEPEKSARQVSATEISEETSLQPTRKVSQPLAAWQLPTAVIAPPGSPPKANPLITKKLEPEQAGKPAVLTGKKKRPASRIIAVVAALILLASILTPTITSTLSSHARGSGSQAKSARIGDTGSASPTTITTATSQVETPVNTKAAIQKTPTAATKATTAPVVVAPPTPTAGTVPTTAPAIVPTPTPTPLPVIMPTPTPTPAPAAKLLASKSSFYAEDDCTWSPQDVDIYWICSETLSNTSGALNSISWSASFTGDGYRDTTSASPSSGVISPGQSVNVTITIDNANPQPPSCTNSPRTFIFTASTNTLNIPWHCSGPMALISPTRLGGANHLGCTLYSPGTDWTCIVTITAQKPGEAIWNVSVTGITNVTFPSDSTGVYQLGSPGTMTATIPVSDCPATATFTISTPYDTFTIPWSC